MGLTAEVLGLGTPAQLQFCGQYGLGNVRVDDLVHISCVTAIGITDDSQRLALSGLEYGEQGVLLLSLFLSLLVLGIVLLAQLGSQVGGSSLHGVGSSLSNSSSVSGDGVAAGRSLTA